MTDHPHDAMPEGHEPPPPGLRTMAAVRWALVGLMALAAVISAVDYVRANRAAAAATDHGDQPIYYCPMHPSVVQDHPGECPICSMTLVLRESRGARPAATAEPSDVPGLVSVDLPSDRVQRIGMRTAAARHTPVSPSVRTVGYVTASEERQAKIHPRFAGWIERLYASQTGMPVKRGQVLATIYSPEVLTAQQEYLNARRWARDGSDVHQLTAGLAGDAKRRLELLGIAATEIAELERSGKTVNALPLRSPVDGVVIAKTAVQGAYVEPNAELFEVADLSAVWVLADVYERDLARMTPGLVARLTLNAWPGMTWTGRVEFVPPTVTSESRTARVRIAFANDDGRLRPGLYGDVQLDLPHGDALVVPREAVVDTGAVQYVFISRPGGHFEPRRVTLGARVGDDVEVTDGLAEGDVVVTTANFLIDSESRLRAAIAGSSGGSGNRGTGGAPAATPPGHVH